MLQAQLAFTIGSRNKQAILDSYQSEIFCYTMNPLMIKPREYKLSWPSLYGQDDWILASFFFFFFMDRDFVYNPMCLVYSFVPAAPHVLDLVLKPE